MELLQGKELSGHVWIRFCCAPGADQSADSISFIKPFIWKIRQAFQGCRKTGVQIIFKFTVICSSLIYPACVSTFPSETSFFLFGLTHTKWNPNDFIYLSYQKLPRWVQSEFWYRQKWIASGKEFRLMIEALMGVYCDIFVFTSSGLWTIFPRLLDRKFVTFPTSLVLPSLCFSFW